MDASDQSAVTDCTQTRSTFAHDYSLSQVENVPEEIKTEESAAVFRTLNDIISEVDNKIDEVLPEIKGDTNDPNTYADTDAFLLEQVTNCTPSTSSDDETAKEELELDRSDYQGGGEDEHNTPNPNYNDGDANNDYKKTEKTGGGCSSSRTFKIFVSNLPPGFHSSELTELFQPYGDVVECVIFAKNYAFVHMGSDESGWKAMKVLHGLEIRGCKINVKKSENVRRPDNVINDYCSEEVGTYKLYINNLFECVTKEYVSKLLESFGRVVEVEIYRDTAAFVHMETEEGGKKAIEQLNGKVLEECERPLVISESKNPEGPSLAVTKLKVKQVPALMTAEALRDLFAPYGLVLKVQLFSSKSVSLEKNDRTGIVHLEQFGNIRSAIKDMNGKKIQSSVLHVEPFFESEIHPSKQFEKPTKQTYFPPFRPILRKPQYDEPCVRIPRDLPPPSKNSPSRHGPMLHSRFRAPPITSMRLIPMPSQVELQKFPRMNNGRGRVLLPDPPYTKNDVFQQHFQQGYNDNQNSHEFGFDYNEAEYNNHNTNEGNYYQHHNFNQRPGNINYASPRIDPHNNTRNNAAHVRPHPNKIELPRGGTSNALFPAFPSPDKFPKVSTPPQLMDVQVNCTENLDWSSDYPISNFSQYANTDDFTSDKPIYSSLSAVPLDYSQMNKNKSMTKFAQENSNFGPKIRNPSSQFYTKQTGMMRGNKGNKNRKGKSRRPGLGTMEQQKKSANQCGNDADILANDQQDMSMQTQPAPVPVKETSSTAPHYFQQNWSFTKTKYPLKNRKSTPKELKQSEDEQKKLYSDYLKQKPWLYQAIAGTVKKVQK